MPLVVCNLCNKPVEIAPVPFLDDAPSGFFMCPACALEQHAEEGGLVVEPGPIEGARFDLGGIAITGGVARALADSKEPSRAFIERHARGDWGIINEGDGDDDLDEEDDEDREPSTSEQNDMVVNKTPGVARLIHSAYRTSKGVTFWVMTDLVLNRTTLLLPSEY